MPQVAAFFGVGPDTVKRWRSQGMPGGRGGYDLSEIAQWLRTDGPWQPRAVADPAAEPGEVSSPAMEKMREETFRIKRLERLAKEGSLLPRAGVHHTLTIMANRFRAYGEQLQREFGDEAHKLTEEMLRDLERMIENEIGEGEIDVINYDAAE